MPHNLLLLITAPLCSALAHRHLLREFVTKGATSRVTAVYENHLRLRSAGAERKENQAQAPPSPQGTPLWIRAISLNGHISPVDLEYGQDLEIIVEYECVEERAFWIAVGIRRNDGLILHAVSMAQDWPRPMRRKGAGQVVLKIPALPLLQGEYAVVAHILDEAGVHCYHSKESSPFSIRPTESWQNEMGILRLRHQWKVL